MHNDQAPTSERPVAETAAARANPQWGKPLLAAILSLLITGLGQAYNRNWKRTLLVVVVSLVFDILFLRMGVWATFRGLILLLASLFLWRIWTAVDAATEARRRQRNPVTVTWAITLGAVAVVIGGAALEASDWFYPLATFRAFRIPSGSMCPTLCVGDRIIADMKVFRSRDPQRGEVVMFLFDREKALHVKRVIAVGGDQISNSKGGILVNGSPIEVPRSACGTVGGTASDYQLAGQIHELQNPANSVFLVGDDLDNSFDSRFYGAVDVKRLRGKPLYLYWSWTTQRIGCAIR
jgi:signal peptidase I